MNKTNNSSPIASAVGAVSKDEETVFTTIFRKDRDWINKTKDKLNRQERLHVIIEAYRRVYNVF